MLRLARIAVLLSAVLLLAAGPAAAGPTPAVVTGAVPAMPASSGAWRAGAPFPGAASAQPALLSCASQDWCLAVDQQFQQTWILQAGKWRTGAFGASGQGVPTALDCTGQGFCTGADAQGDILTFAHDRWSAKPGPSQQGGGPMSCGTANMCLFVNGVGQWFSWDGHRASRPQVAYPSLANTMGSGIYAVSCAPGTAFCAAADSLGSLGTFDAGRWGPLYTKVKAPPVALGCYSARACIAAFRGGPGSGSSGQWATWDGAVWSVHTGGSRGVPPVPASAALLSCSAKACVVVDDVHGHSSAYRWTSKGWSTPAPMALQKAVSPQLLSCSPAGPCLAVEAGSSPGRSGTTWSGE